MKGKMLTRVRKNVVRLVLLAVVVAAVSPIAGIGENALAQSKEVVIYGWAGNWDLWFGDWAKRFFDDTGIRISYISGPGTQMRQRIMVEQASRSDIFISTPGDAFSLAAGGMLADIPWDKMPATKNVDDRFKFKQVGIWGYDLWLLAYNKKLVPEAQVPKSIADLADPKWRRQLSLPDPTEESSTRLFMVLEERSGEEKAWQTLEGIYKNAVLTWNTPGDAERSLAFGSAALGPMSMGMVMVAAQQAGGDVGVVVPRDGVFLMLNSISIMRNAPNMKNAVTFVEWYFDKYAQNDIMNNLGISIATNTAVPLTNKALAQIGLGGVTVGDVLKVAYVPDWPTWLKRLPDGTTRFGQLQSEIDRRLRLAR